MKNYKVSETIEIRVRTDGDPASDNPTVVIYDEAEGEFVTLTIGDGLTQVGTTRAVKGSFVPDAAGVWMAKMTDDTGMELLKAYAVGDYSVMALGTMLAALDSKVEAQDLVLANLLTNTTGGGGHFA